MSNTLGKFILTNLFIIFLHIPNANSEDTFLWLDDIDYAPLVSYDKEGNPKGLFVDVIREVFRRIDVPLEIRLYPWKRTQILVKLDKGDGMLTVPTPERKRYLYPTDAVFKFTWKLFTHSGNSNLQDLLNIRKLSDLEPYKILTYAGNGWAMENLKNLNVTYAPTLSDSIKILAKSGRRVDAMIEQDFIIYYNLKRFVETEVITAEEVDKITENPHVFEEVSFHFLIRKNSKFSHIIPNFNQALMEMRQDGTFDSIQSAYTGLAVN